jgi:hypothetical protein
VAASDRCWAHSYQRLLASFSPSRSPSVSIGLAFPSSPPRPPPARIPSSSPRPPTRLPLLPAGSRPATTSPPPAHFRPPRLGRRRRESRPPHLGHRRADKVLSSSLPLLATSASSRYARPLSFLLLCETEHPKPYFSCGSESSYNIYVLTSISFARIIGCTCVHPCPMLVPPLISICSAANA